MVPPIYLDGFATMPLSPEARDAMMASWSVPANAGSPHVFGARASAAIEDARAAVADLVGAGAAEITFTSGATEADNIAILGSGYWALERDDPRRRVVVSAIEHKAVLGPAQRLRSLGFEVAVAPVDERGIVDCTALAALVDTQTLIVSVMAANNETGVLQPVSEVAAIGRAFGALVHCDAAQAVGKIAIDVVKLDVDYLSISSHKLYGPMGVGALYVAGSAARPSPLHFGGGQENGLRPGTVPVPLIVGLGAASRCASRSLAADAQHGEDLAHLLQARLNHHGVVFRLTAKGAVSLPGSLSLSIEGVEADDLVGMLQDRVCFSTGSACASGQVTPSHVLTSMGIDNRKASSVFRLYFNRYNTATEAEEAADIIAETALRIARRAGSGHQLGL